MDPKVAIVLIFLAFAVIEALQGSLFRKSTEQRGDLLVESLSIVLLFGFTQPFIVFAVDGLMSFGLPSYRDSLTNLHWLWGVGLFLLFDDMMQYWWHRLSHSYRALYKLHRAHHNARYMSVRVVYRNNFFYYLLMPSIWFSAVLVYLGLGWIYAVFLVVKQTVIIGAHAEWKWDRALYRHNVLHPVMWVVERIISTPSTHSGHHGRHRDDPATHYKGNFGNLLFFWDVLFGTARITRSYPEHYGVEGLKPSNWREQLFWPLQKTPSTTKQPLSVAHPEQPKSSELV